MNCAGFKIVKVNLNMFSRSMEGVFHYVALSINRVCSNITSLHNLFKQYNKNSTLLFYNILLLSKLTPEHSGCDV